MRRNVGSSLAGLLASLLLMSACGPVPVTVIAVDGESDEDGTSLGNLEVRMLPYDRDQIFDSLENAALTPEPQVPPDLLAAREEIAEAQREWRETETRWNALRDTLGKLNTVLERLNRGENRYRTLFRDWTALDNQRARAERQVSTLFERFESLQAASIGRMDSMRFTREDWADQAFVDFDEIALAKIDASGLDPVADTTNAQGMAAFSVPPGEYWINARSMRVFDELYWNVPIVVARGELLEVRLSHENAEVRPIF